MGSSSSSSSSSSSVASASVSASASASNYYSGAPYAAGGYANGSTGIGSTGIGSLSSGSCPGGSLSSNKSKSSGATPDKEHDRKTSEFLKWLEENHGEGKYDVKVYSRPVGGKFPGSLASHHSIVIQYKKAAYIVIEWAQNGLSVNEHKGDKDKVVGSCIRTTAKDVKL